MPVPTFVAAYNCASYTTTDTPKTVSLTTQAGDLLVVYAGTADSTTTVNAPSGNSISFTEQQSFFTSGNCSAHLWTGVDSTGGTNWTLTCSRAGSALMWGFTCVVFRNSAGFGVTNGATDITGSPTLNLTTSANSAVVVFNADWLADGTSRTWKSVNGITPSVGNGLELTYAWDSVNYTAYGAYYNDTGSAGSNAYGLLFPSNQKYTIVAMEVLAGTTLAPSVTTNPVTNITASTATGNGNVTSDGGSAITERGVCWSTSPNPTTSDSKATSAGTTGAFTASITGLTGNTLYHVRAYATNAVGTSYGSDVTFQYFPSVIAWLGV